ncbi:MAG TPA: glycosyltransferase family 4 protein [Cytophagaceae bacterium]|jgi:glycosyltransferase involved in cell wall biosynthesis|nr:glycosyltransferase family 4 protein [Cytophagaceae bacterium]
MKILYLHQYFLTPEQGGAIRSYHLAKALVEAGHEVIMITSHNHKGYHYENIEGIKVHYLPVFYENNLNSIGRVISFAKFMYRAFIKAREIKDVDLCYATSTPLTIGIIALLLKRFHHIKFYFEVRDLWPEAPIQMGTIKNYFAKKILYALEKKIYTKAEKIIALSPGILEGIKKVAPQKDCYMIPNFADCTYFYPEEKKHEFEIQFGIKETFVISYFGALGKANHLDYLINAALELAKNKIENIHFIIAGRGAELHSIKDKVKTHSLTNISFVGFINKTSLHDMLNVTDAIYISFANKPILETNSPNKFFDGLAAGKLCISNTKGWMKELIEKNNCGFYYDPEKPETFIEKIIPYTKNTSLLKNSQHNARKLAEQEFSKDIMTGRFLTIFNNHNN